MPGTWKTEHRIAEQWGTGTAVALNYMLFGISNGGLTRLYYVSDVRQ